MEIHSDVRDPSMCGIRRMNGGKNDEIKLCKFSSYVLAMNGNVVRICETKRRKRVEKNLKRLSIVDAAFLVIQSLIMGGRINMANVQCRLIRPIYIRSQLQRGREGGEERNGKLCTHKDRVMLEL